MHCSSTDIFHQRLNEPARVVLARTVLSMLAEPERVVYKGTDLLEKGMKLENK